MDEGTDENGGLVEGSDLEFLLKKSVNFDGMSRIQKMDWMN